VGDISGVEMFHRGELSTVPFSSSDLHLPTGSHLVACRLLEPAVVVLGLDLGQVAGLLLVFEQQAPHLGELVPPPEQLLRTQSLRCRDTGQSQLHAIRELR